MGIYLKILAFGALIAGLSVLAQPTGAWAQTAGQTGQGGGTQIAPQTCDTNVWQDMAQRARIETEREIMQNQNLIYKPDSVLTYTCFDSLAAHTAAKAGVLFTHTSYWNPMPLQWGTQYGMDTAVNNVVINAMKTYVTGNFNHAYLGGRGSVDGLGLGRNEANAQASSGSSYACSAMGEVWAKAKCINFLHGTEFANSDGYYPFINLKGQNGSPEVDGYETKKDVRKYPTACSGDPIAGSSWPLAYRDARNESGFGNPNKDYKYGQPLDEAFKEVRKRVAPYGSEGATSCADPIPTGVTVILGPGSGNSQPYADGVCTNPGCHYTKNKQCSATGSNGT